MVASSRLRSALICLLSFSVHLSQCAEWPFLSVNSGNRLSRPYIADFDYDQRLDVIAAPVDGSELGWYRNSKSGVFNKYSIKNAPTSVSTLITSDVDSNGNADIISSSSVAGGVIVSTDKTGKGDFVHRTMVSSPEFASAIATGYLENSLKQSIVAFLKISSRLVWLSNIDLTSLNPPLPTQTVIPLTTCLGSVASPGYLMQVLVSDVNADRKNDLITVSSTGVICWLENAGAAASFTEHVIATFPPFLDGAFPVDVADVNYDGRVDLVVASSRNASIAVVQQVYSPTSPVSVSWTVNYVAATSPGASSVIVRDVTADGRADLVTGWGNAIRVYEHKGFVNSVPQFAPSSVYMSSYSLSDYSLDNALFETADLDRDGDLDMVVAAPGSSSLFILVNPLKTSHDPGSGSFLDPSQSGDKKLDGGVQFWVFFLIALCLFILVVGLVFLAHRKYEKQQQDDLHRRANTLTMKGFSADEDFDGSNATYLEMPITNAQAATLVPGNRYRTAKSF